MDKFVKIPKFMALFTFYLILSWSFEFMGSSFLMHYENNNALLYTIVLIVVSLFLIIILKLNCQNLLKKIHRIVIFQIISSLYLLISIVLSFFLLITILKNWFYSNTPFFILIILFLLVNLLIHHNLRFVFYLGFFLGLVFFIPNILPIFCTNGRNFSFITFINFRFTNFWVILSIFYLFLDILIYYPLNIQFTKPIKKIDLLLVVLLAGISALLMMADNYLFLLPNIFTSFNQPGLLKYRIYQLDPLGESLDFLLIIDLVYLLTIKNSLSLFLIRTYQGFKKNQISYWLLIIILIVFPLILLNINHFYLVIAALSSILSGLMLIYYLLLYIISIKEAKNEK